MNEPVTVAPERESTNAIAARKATLAANRLVRRGSLLLVLAVILLGVAAYLCFPVVANATSAVVQNTTLTLAAVPSVHSPADLLLACQQLSDNAAVLAKTVEYRVESALDAAGIPVEQLEENISGPVRDLYYKIQLALEQVAYRPV